MTLTYIESPQLLHTRIMFAGFLAGQLDITLANMRNSPHLKFEQFKPIYAAIEAYLVKHRLVVSDEQQDSIRMFKVYGPSIFYHANALANVLAKITPWVRLNTDVRDKEFTITIDSSPMVRMFNIHPEFAKIIDPCISANALAIVPPEVELVDVYHRLYSPALAKTWESLRQYEDKQWRSFVATRQTIMSCDKSGGARLNEHTEIVIAWAKSMPNVVIVGNHAVSCVSETKCQISGAVQLIVGDTKNAIEGLRRYITETIGLETTLKMYELNLPTDHRIRKYVLSVRVGQSMYYVANIFNSPTHELVPYREIGQLRVGTLCVLLRFLFIDLWFLRMLHHFGVLAEADFTRAIGHLFENIDWVHDKWASEVIDRPPIYVGVYKDEAIGKKLGDVVYPYFPAQYAANHDGQYRQIGTRE